MRLLASRLAGLVFVLCVPDANAAGDVPRPPCAGRDALPSYSTDATAPTVESWIALGWKPPPCLGWSEGTYRFVVALAGEMQAESSEDVLAGLGAVSSTRGLRYWSVTDQAWQVLIEDAVALTRADDGEARVDFSAREMKVGEPLFFREKDNRSSAPVTYRMRVHEADAEHVLVETENVSSIRSLGVTMFPAESLRTAYFVRRRSARQWSLYLLSAATADASRLVGLGHDSYVNRALAAYRHLANVPTPSDSPAGARRSQ